MLHLYEVTWNRFDDGCRLFKRRPKLDIERFATALFRWTHTHCPQLEILVCGLYTRGFDVSKVHSWESGRDEDESDEDESDEDEPGEDEPFPQVFFMKSKEAVQGHGDRILATPTTRSRIRDSFPELVLPTFDPCFDEFVRLAI